MRHSLSMKRPCVCPSSLPNPTTSSLYSCLSAQYLKQPTSSWHRRGFPPRDPWLTRASVTSLTCGCPLSVQSLFVLLSPPTASQSTGSQQYSPECMMPLLAVRGHRPVCKRGLHELLHSVQGELCKQLLHTLLPDTSRTSSGHARDTDAYPTLFAPFDLLAAQQTSRRVAPPHPHAAEHHPSQPAHELPPFPQSHHRAHRPITRVRFYETDPASKCSLAGDGMRERLSRLACNQFGS